MRAVVFTSLLLAACGGLPEAKDSQEQTPTEKDSQQETTKDPVEEKKADTPSPVVEVPKDEETPATEVKAAPEPVVGAKLLKDAAGLKVGSGTLVGDVYSLTIAYRSSLDSVTMSGTVSLADGFKASGEPLYCYYFDATCGGTVPDCVFEKADRLLVLSATEVLMPKATTFKSTTSSRPFNSRRLSGVATCDADKDSFPVLDTSKKLNWFTSSQVTVTLPLTAQ